jgi:hypothetical protein
MANKPVDPTPHIEAVDNFLRSSEATLRNLAQREAIASNKPTESLPTSTSNTDKGKATKTLQVIEKLKEEKEDISKQHEANIQQKHSNNGLSNH